MIRLWIESCLRREDVRDPLARVPVAVDRLHLVAAVRHLPANSVRDLGRVVADVDDVRAAVAAVLARPDVHGRRADERALADRRRGVADDAGRLRHQPDVVVRRQVLEEVQLRVVVVLAPLADPGGDVLGARVRVRPEHDRRHVELLHGLERLRDLPLAVAVLRRDRMLRDEQERLVEREASRRRRSRTGR